MYVPKTDIRRSLGLIAVEIGALKDVGLSVRKLEIEPKMDCPLGLAVPSWLDWWLERSSELNRIDAFREKRIVVELK